MFSNSSTPSNGKFNEKKQCSIFGDFPESAAGSEQKLPPRISKIKEVNFQFSCEQSEKIVPTTISINKAEHKTFSFPIISSDRNSELNECAIQKNENQLQVLQEFKPKQNKFSMLKANKQQLLDTDGINNMFTCGGEIGIKKINTPENDLLLKEINILSKNLVIHMDNYDKQQKYDLDEINIDMPPKISKENLKRPNSVKNSEKLHSIEFFRPSSTKVGGKNVNIDFFVNKNHNNIKQGDDEYLGKKLLYFPDKLFEKTSKYTKLE